MAEVTFGAEISEDRSLCAVAEAWREANRRVAGKVVVWGGAEPALTGAVRGAQARRLAGAQALERRGVGVDQSPFTASEFAVWALQRWEETSSPGVYVI